MLTKNRTLSLAETAALVAFTILVLAPGHPNTFYPIGCLAAQGAKVSTANVAFTEKITYKKANIFCTFKAQF
jgi:hypothetical protein